MVKSEYADKYGENICFIAILHVQNMNRLWMMEQSKLNADKSILSGTEVVAKQAKIE